MGSSGSKQDHSAKRKSGKLPTTADLLAAETEAEQHAALLAQMKERRKAELLAIEEQRMTSLAEEIQLNSSSKAQRNQLLNHVTENQKQLENHIKQVQEQQELSRQKLSEDLYLAELELEKNIGEVLKETSMHRDPGRLKEMIEVEEKQVQSLLALKLEEYRNLRKADVLSAMGKQLEREMDLCNKNPIQTTTKVNLIIMSDSAQEQEIEKILRDRQRGQEELVSHLIKEEAWQRHAFVHLLSQRDKRSTQLRSDISLVIDQLNQLTSLEMQRKSRKINMSSVALSETRLQLAELLSVLIRQQEQRRQDLTNLLAEMEEQRQNQAADYWLMQYQRLMESAPAFLNRAPLSSSSCDTSFPSSTMPSSLPSGSIQSSAPPAEEVADEEADAPMANEVFLETTCVICMDSLSQVIFLTCGHLCCCVKCGDAVPNCPLCRSLVVQRLRVQF